MQGQQENIDKFAIRSPELEPKMSLAVVFRKTESIAFKMFFEDSRNFVSEAENSAEPRANVWQDAVVAELVDAHDSNSCAARRVGSIPTYGTDEKKAFPSTREGFFVTENLIELAQN